MEISNAELDRLIAEQDNRMRQREKNLAEGTDCTKSSGFSFLGCVRWFFEFLFGGRKKIEDKHLPSLIQSRMLSVMDELMKKRFDEKELVADAVALTEKDQARYFYEHLRQIRCHDKKEKNEEKEII